MTIQERIDAHAERLAKATQEKNLLLAIDAELKNIKAAEEAILNLEQQIELL